MILSFSSHSDLSALVVLIHEAERDCATIFHDDAPPYCSVVILEDVNLLANNIILEGEHGNQFRR